MPGVVIYENGRGPLNSGEPANEAVLHLLQMIGSLNLEAPRDTSPMSDTSLPPYQKFMATIPDNAIDTFEKHMAVSPIYPYVGYKWTAEFYAQQNQMTPEQRAALDQQLAEQQEWQAQQDTYGEVWATQEAAAAAAAAEEQRLADEQAAADAAAEAQRQADAAWAAQEAANAAAAAAAYSDIVASENPVYPIHDDSNLFVAPAQAAPVARPWYKKHAWLLAAAGAAAGTWAMLFAGRDE